MIRQIYLLLVCFLPIASLAQTGKVFDNLSLDSKVLNMERKYAIYLPADYEMSERTYPVLYLLHGGGDNQTGWIQFGEANFIADKAIKEGVSTAMIIVMPDASAGRKGYFNSVKGDWLYEDFFFEEFIPFIEGKYRVKTEKRYRAIAGLSMGGGGTFVYALHHPELFSSACPLSANCGPVDLEDNGRFSWSWKSGPDGDAAELTLDDKTKILEQRGVIHLLKSMPEEQKNAVEWYIDCGDDDSYFADKNSLVHITMLENKISHEYRVRNGGHKWQYWREALPEVLCFVSKTFRQH
jgi:enterochelin esterase-like enzyme